MAGLLTLPFFDVGAGITPADGALLYFNVVGSETDKDTYTTAAATTPHTNPVVADSKGVFPAIYLSGDYDWVLQDKNLVQQNTGSVSELITGSGQLVNVLARDTLNDAVIDTSLQTGLAINIAERTTGNGGGAMWDVVLSSTVTENTYNIVQCTGVGTLSLVLRVGDSASSDQFGAVGDNATDNKGAIDAALALGITLDFVSGIYRYGTYDSPQTLTLTQNGQNINLNGATLALPLAGILVAADDVVIDLGGGKLTELVRYAEFAATTTVGQQTFDVVDSQYLAVGQYVASSWGNTSGSGEYPMGGPTGATKKTITNIVGNTITLDLPLSGSTQTMQAGVVFGEFTFRSFISLQNQNLLVKNGSIDRVGGWYYFTPNGVNTTGGKVFFDNIDFEGNGVDQMQIKHNQSLHLNNCTMVQQWDYAKSGIWFDSTAYVYITNCPSLSLGNYDSSFSVRGLFNPMAGGELQISDSVIKGTNLMTSPPASSFGVDVLYAIELKFDGSFDRIGLSNVRFVDYTRHLVSSTTTTETTGTVINSIKVNECSVDASFGNFIFSGSGNGITCPIVQVANTSFFQDDPYVFWTLSSISGASSSFTPHFDDCYFKLTSSGNGVFNGESYVNNGTFNQTDLFYRNIHNVHFHNTKLINSSRLINSPTSDVNAGGYAGDFIVDSDSFPSDVGDVFLGFGSSTANGLHMAKARSSKGSVMYDVFKGVNDIRLNGDFVIANGEYQLRDDDYYLPFGSRIRDLWTGASITVTKSAASTLTADAASGATSLTVADTSSMAGADRFNIVLDDGVVDTLTISTIDSGTTLTLTTGITGDATSGNAVLSFLAS